MGKMIFPKFLVQLLQLKTDQAKNFRRRYWKKKENVRFFLCDKKFIFGKLCLFLVKNGEIFAVVWKNVATGDQKFF
jgi:hypothetical protein